MSDLSTQLSNIKTRLKKAAKEAGNVLFMILIAVALFAALAYAVTQSTRSGGGDATQETAILDSSTIVQQATELQNTIMRMRISNNCSDTQLSFENPIASGYINPSAPANKSCHIYDPAGGGITYKKLPSSAADTAYTSYSWYLNPRIHSGASVWNISGCNGSSAQCADLIFFAAGLKKSVCIAINQKLGITNPSGNPPTGTSDLNIGQFTGAYGVGGYAFGYDAGQVLELRGQYSGCFQVLGPTGEVPPPAYVFLHVLLPR